MRRALFYIYVPEQYDYTPDRDALLAFPPYVAYGEVTQPPAFAVGIGNPIVAPILQIDKVVMPQDEYKRQAQAGNMFIKWEDRVWKVIESRDMGNYFRLIVEANNRAIDDAPDIAVINDDDQAQIGDDILIG